jgi:malate permease and related proteins
MDMQLIITQMLTLFFGMAVGYAAYKFKVLDNSANRVLSNLVMNITLPFFILSSVMGGERTLSNIEVFYIFGISLISYGLCLVIALIIPKAPLFKNKDEKMYSFMLLFGNVGFMGMPIVSSLFGSQALFFASVFNMPFYIFLYTVGLYFVSGDFKFSPKLFLNSGIISSFAALIIYLIDIPVPDIFSQSFTLIGQITPPAAMLIIGSTLAAIPVAHIFTNVRLYIISFIRLLVMPMLILFILKQFVTDTDILGIAVVLTAMPVATNSTMLCLQYNGNHELASDGIFISTVLSIITIPVIVLFL